MIFRYYIYSWHDLIDSWTQTQIDTHIILMKFLEAKYGARIKVMARW